MWLQQQRMPGHRWCRVRHCKCVECSRHDFGSLCTDAVQADHLSVNSSLPCCVTSTCCESTGVGGPVNEEEFHVVHLYPLLCCFPTFCSFGGFSQCRGSMGLGGPLNEEEFHVIQGVLDLFRT
jgi:hypothetical protein